MDPHVEILAVVAQGGAFAGRSLPKGCAGAAPSLHAQLCRTFAAALRPAWVLPVATCRLPLPALGAARLANIVEGWQSSPRARRCMLVGASWPPARAFTTLARRGVCVWALPCTR